MTNKTHKRQIIRSNAQDKLLTNIKGVEILLIKKNQKKSCKFLYTYVTHSEDFSFQMTRRLCYLVFGLINTL